MIFILPRVAGEGEGLLPHPEEPAQRASRRMLARTADGAWFETRGFAALLTMRKRGEGRACIRPRPPAPPPPCCAWSPSPVSRGRMGPWHVLIGAPWRAVARMERSAIRERHGRSFTRFRFSLRFTRAAVLRTLRPHARCVSSCRRGRRAGQRPKYLRQCPPNEGRCG
jgi:hypothetical protein